MSATEGQNPQPTVLVAEDEDASQRELRARRRKLQMIFQDPYGSLNPRFTIEDVIGEALDIHGLTDGAAARRKRIAELLEAVGVGLFSVAAGAGIERLGRITVDRTKSRAHDPREDVDLGR